MRNRGLIAAGAILAGTVLFVATRPMASDHRSSWTRFLNSNECDGAAADVSGSKGRFTWDGSDHVTIAVPAKIRWRRGEGTEMVLRGDGDDLERIRLDEGTLRVCGHIENEIEITLPGQAFHAVTIAGAGELTMIDIDQDALDLTIAGAGRMQADGRSEDLKVTIAGAGEAILGDLSTKRLKLTIAGAGEAEASPTEDADVTVVGAGDVKLLTRPQRHDFDVIGSGEVKMPDRT